MVAPQPIQIRYGSPGTLGLLAASAGQAAFTQSEQARGDREHELALGLAAQMRQGRGPSSFYTPAPDPFALQQAATFNRQTAQKAGSATMGRHRSPLQLAQDEERLKGQQLRNQQLQGKMAAPGLVPASGPLNAPRGSMSMTMPDGQTVTGEDLRSQGLLQRPEDNQDLVTPGVRNALDTISADPSLNDAARGWLNQAVRSGLTLNEAVLRAGDLGLLPRSQSKQPETAALRNARMDLAKIDGIIQRGDPAEMERFARANELRVSGWNKDYGPVLHELRQQLQDALTSVETNRGNAAPASGPAPAPSGVVQVGSDEDYAALPSGTRFIGPDGVRRVKP